ncbi:MAG: hypothetical protein SPH42_04320 [Gemmiger sp.]|uniref:hypothetical protein n=1 Tax=Gemmiger sp. TaxID=2049027 RepID=UPI002A911BB8|nr:hypothetical protein [Gemmiger sp.]MDY5326068.1 hypothetical protein [Gemmiger sp.]
MAGQGKVDNFFEHFTKFCRKRPRHTTLNFTKRILFVYNTNRKSKKRKKCQKSLPKPENAIDKRRTTGYDKEE